MVAVREGAVDESRKRKPSIPLVNERGVPIRDEIEMERRLSPHADGNLHRRRNASMQKPVVPDPIDEPKAYQEYLLGLLGDDDPAGVQARTPAALRQLAAEAGPHLGLRPEPHGMVCVRVHGPHHGRRGRHVRPVSLGARPERTPADRVRPGSLGRQAPRGRDGLDSLLDLFDALRLANVTLWQRTRGELRQRVGLHAERGPESYDLAFRMIAGHDRFHVAQARRTLEALAVDHRALSPIGRPGSPPAAPPRPVCRAARCRCRTWATARTMGSLASTGTV